MWKLTGKYFPVVCIDQRGGWSVNIQIKAFLLKWTSVHYYKNYNIIESQYMIAIIYLCL